MLEEQNKEINTLKIEIREKIEQAKEMDKMSSEYNSIINEIWEKSKEKFVFESDLNENVKKYKGIIFTIGFTPEPIILNILANKPENVYFIYTEESKKTLNKIIEDTKLPPSQFQMGLMPKDSASESYRLVKKGLKYLKEECKIEREDIALDPTGGTKIMSVGCGIGATIFNLDILYINTGKYDPILRRPVPGTEILVNIPNPFNIYQDDKLIEGINYLKSLNFNKATYIFYNVVQSSSNPLFPKLLASIANILHFWDMIDYDNAIKFIEESTEIIQILGTKISPIKEDLIRAITSWKEYLIIINKPLKEGKFETEKISSLLIYDIKENADREFYNSMYNNAALKYYRTIEMINQYILLNEYKIDTQNPIYGNIPQKISETIKDRYDDKENDIETIILNQYNDIWRFLHEKKEYEKKFLERKILPYKIGLIAGIIFRFILGDPSLNRDSIFNTLQAVEKRNLSIFAHGIVSIKKKDCDKLKKITEKMIENIEIDLNFKNKVFNKGNLELLANLFYKIL